MGGMEEREATRQGCCEYTSVQSELAGIESCCCVECDASRCCAACDCVWNEACESRYVYRPGRSKDIPRRESARASVGIAACVSMTMVSMYARYG